MVLKTSHGFDRACLLYLSGSSNCGDSVRVELLRNHAKDVGTWSFIYVGWLASGTCFQIFSLFQIQGIFRATA